MHAESPLPLRDLFIQDIVDWYRPSLAVPGGTPADGQRLVCYHELNALVDDFVAQARSEHRNPRVGLLPPDDHTAQDLLERDNKEMPYLEGLRVALIAAEPELPEQVAIVAVALTGGHCARMDSNAEAAASVWAWSNSAAGDGWTPEDIAPLRVVECFAATAAARAGGTASFTLEKIDEIAAESRAQLHMVDSPADCDPEALRRHRRVLAHLTETIASLPARLLREETEGSGYRARYGDWAQQRALGWFPESHGLAVFHQHNARILLALGDLDGARREVEQALARAKPHMLQSIEASRQMQLAIDLEDLSRADITQTVTSNVTQTAANTVEEKSRSLQQNLLDEMRENAAQERDATRNEIKDALLRVVEILGVFLTVAAIGVTAIGGIAVDGDPEVRIAIWGFGYGSIVSLFWLLRRIAGAPGVRDTLNGIRETRRRRRVP